MTKKELIAYVARVYDTTNKDAIGIITGCKTEMLHAFATHRGDTDEIFKECLPGVDLDEILLVIEEF